MCWINIFFGHIPDQIMVALSFILIALNILVGSSNLLGKKLKEQEDSKTHKRGLESFFSQQKVCAEVEVCIPLPLHIHIYIYVIVHCTVKKKLCIVPFLTFPSYMQR